MQNDKASLPPPSLPPPPLVSFSIENSEVPAYHTIATQQLSLSYTGAALLCSACQGRICFTQEGWGQLSISLPLVSYLYLALSLSLSLSLSA
jgi:hypothetical protein